MIDLRGSWFTDIMPENLASQLETQAFAYALGRQIEKLCIYADGVHIYAAVASVPEKILDVLAVELRTPAYRDNFPVDVKRRLIAGTLPFYTKLGTPAAVGWIIQTILGDGGIEEWYEYGGEPHHFRIRVLRDHAATSLEYLKQFLQAVYFVKRLSSWLDEIVTTLHPSTTALHLGGIFSAVTTIPIPEERDSIELQEILRLGQTGGAVTRLPIPEKPDALSVTNVLRAGGSPAVRTAIPIPESR